MQAIILAGGKGKRLTPYTMVFPKPLMPIDDKPILEIIINQLKSNNFNRITMAVGHLNELIKSYFEDGSKWGLDIKYSVENTPLGTAGPLRLIDDFENDFIVMNGDILTDFKFDDFYNYHLDTKSLCTIAVYKKDVKIDLGVLELNNDNEIVNYNEKPILKYDVSMGIYAFNKKILKYIPLNKYYDFPDLILDLLKRRKRVNAFTFNGLWLDIGRLEDYQLATEEFLKNRVKIEGSL